MSGPADLPLQVPPTDTVSSLAFSPANNNLAAAAWNGEIKIWDVNAPQGKPPLFSKPPDGCPILSITWLNDSTIAYADAFKKTIFSLALPNGQPTPIGSHALPIRRICYAQDISSLVSGSWDRTVNIWSPSSPQKPSLTINLTERVYGLDYTPQYVTVATANHATHVYDIRNPQAPLYTDQTKDNIFTCVSALPGPQGGVACYLAGAVEGLVRASLLQGVQKPLTFEIYKQRRKKDGITHIHPVEDIDCLYQQSVFAIGGNGCYYEFVQPNPQSSALQSCGTITYTTQPITSLRFSQDGKYLAYATGVSWERGPPLATESRMGNVFLHAINPQFDLVPQQKRR